MNEQDLRKKAIKALKANNLSLPKTIKETNFILGMSCDELKDSDFPQLCYDALCSILSGTKKGLSLSSPQSDVIKILTIWDKCSENKQENELAKFIQKNMGVIKNIMKSYETETKDYTKPVIARINDTIKCLAIVRENWSAEDEKKLGKAYTECEEHLADICETLKLVSARSDRGALKAANEALSYIEKIRFYISKKLSFKSLVSELSASVDNWTILQKERQTFLAYVFSKEQELNIPEKDELYYYTWYVNNGEIRNEVLSKIKESSDNKIKKLSDCQRKQEELSKQIEEARSKFLNGDITENEAVTLLEKLDASIEKEKSREQNLQDSVNNDVMAKLGERIENNIQEALDMQSGYRPLYVALEGLDYAQLLSISSGNTNNFKLALDSIDKLNTQLATLYTISTDIKKEYESTVSFIDSYTQAHRDKLREDVRITKETANQVVKESTKSNVKTTKPLKEDILAKYGLRKDTTPTNSTSDETDSLLEELSETIGQKNTTTGD